MKTFDNVAQLKLAKLQAGQFVETGGYYEKGGVGAAKYLIKTASEAESDGDVIDGWGNLELANTNVAVRDWTGRISIESIGLKKADGTFDNTIPLQAVHDARLLENTIADFRVPIGDFTFKTPLNTGIRMKLTGVTHYTPPLFGSTLEFDNDTDTFITFPENSSRNQFTDLHLRSKNQYWTFGDVQFPDESYTGNIANGSITNTAISQTSEQSAADSIARVLLEGFGTGLRMPGNWFGRFDDLSILNSRVAARFSQDRTSHLNRFSGVSIAKCTFGLINETSSTFSLYNCNISRCIIAVDLSFSRSFGITDCYMELNESVIRLNDNNCKINVSSTLLTCVNGNFPNNSGGSILINNKACESTFDNCTFSLYYADQYIVDGTTAGANSVTTIKQRHQEGGFTENLVRPGNLGTIYFLNAGGGEIFRGNSTLSTEKKITSITSKNQVTSRSWGNGEHENLTGFGTSEQFFVQTLANDFVNVIFMQDTVPVKNNLIVITGVCDEGNELRVLMKTNASGVRTITEVKREINDTTNVDGGFLATPFVFGATGSGNIYMKSYYTINKTFLLDIKVHSLDFNNNIVMFGVPQSVGNVIQYDQDIV